MSTSPTTLEFQIHRSNGDISKFVAEDAASVRYILEQIQRGKIFTQPSLVLADTNALVVYPGAAITRIDLFIDVSAEDFRTIDFIKDGSQKLEITRDRWQAQIESLTNSQLTRQEVLGGESDIVTTFGRVQLANGDTICMEYQYRSNLPSVVEQRHFFQVVFSLPGFPFTRLGGGISILNPAQIVDCVFHPGGEPPATAWAARFLGDIPKKK
jgi:hypothetical protein